MFGLSRRLTGFANIFAAPLGYQIVFWPLLLVSPVYIPEGTAPYTREVTLGWHFYFTRLDPSKTGMALIFRWYLRLGPVEIRKWVKKPQPRK